MNKRGTPTNSAQSSAQKLLENPIDLTTWMGGLGARDRVNLERHAAALEAEPAHSTLWRRLATALATLAPHAASTTGQQAVQFFVADGKYRMQVFALEDARDGKIMAYATDALDDAMKAELLGRPPRDNPAILPIIAAPGQMLNVESLTAANTPNPSPFFKHMLGWNRKAMRITLPVGSTDAQIAAAEMLFAVSALKWKKDAPKDAAVAVSTPAAAKPVTAKHA
ncbi:MAG: hypothetical protein JO353_08700 [Phycisphaerae bacterium]|nr:hypothetical protein [Phycisphaerae bacterium]